MQIYIISVGAKPVAGYSKLEDAVKHCNRLSITGQPFALQALDLDPEGPKHETLIIARIRQFDFDNPKISTESAIPESTREGIETYNWSVTQGYWDVWTFNGLERLYQMISELKQSIGEKS